MSPKSALLAAVLALTLAPALQAAEASRGLCDLDDDHFFTLGEQVEWEFDPATGANRARLIGLMGTEGEVVGIREHNDGVKINLRFVEGAIFDILEIMVVKTSSVSRLTAVHFSSANGETLVDGIEAFGDAQCAVQ
jgi:hypothetical protein